MTATTFDAIVTQDNSNVRKALKGGVLIGQMSAALPTSLTMLTAGSPPAPPPVLQTLTGFSSFGFISDDGAVFSRDVDTSDIKAWGEADPVRTDITSRVTTLKVTALETNKTTLATYFDKDPDDLVPDDDTGELIITETGDLSTRYYRVLVLSQDGASGSEYWIARLLPRASITDYGDMPFDSGDDTISFDLTFTAYKDATAGFSVQTFIGGPGWLAGLETAGFSS